MKILLAALVAGPFAVEQASSALDAAGVYVGTTPRPLASKRPGI